MTFRSSQCYLHCSLWKLGGDTVDSLTAVYVSVSTVRYDTIRYEMVYLRALKSWHKGQLYLAHGTENKNKEKKKKPG